MHATQLLSELSNRSRWYASCQTGSDQKTYVRNVLRESFAISTGRYLPDHLFLEIWNRVDSTISNLEADLLYHIDDIYHDFAERGSYKHKKKGKSSKRVRRMCKFHICD